MKLKLFEDFVNEAAKQKVEKWSSTDRDGNKTTTYLVGDTTYFIVGYDSSAIGSSVVKLFVNGTPLPDTMKLRGEVDFKEGFDIRRGDKGYRVKPRKNNPNFIEINRYE